MTTRDHQIHWHIERAINTLCSMRKIERAKLYGDMLAYMRGVGSLVTGYAIANAFKAICDSEAINPRIDMSELFSRVEDFIESQEASAA